MADHLTRRAMLGSTGTALAALSGCIASGDSEQTTTTETRRLDVPDAALTIDNIDGPVTVEASDVDEVVVEIAKTGSDGERDATTVTESRDDGRLAIETTHDGGLVGIFSPSVARVELTVRCPGDLVVDRVETTNGDLRVENVAGPVSLDVTNGQIDAAGLSSLGDVSSTNGAVDVAVPAIEGDTLIDSTNGAVDVAIGPDLDADVRAETTNGSVTVDGLSLSTVDDGVTGTLGEGGDDLTIETTNGDISLQASE
mgnify:CR=1 FL=1